MTALRFEQLESRMMLNADVNGDGSVTASDGHIIVNYLDSSVCSELAGDFDTNGDGHVSPVDVLYVFNRIDVPESRGVAAFYVNLLDESGSPIHTVKVGESFFVEITVREFDPARGGLRSVNLDIQWDPSILKEIDAPFDTSTLVTPHLPVFLTGTLDNEAGFIDNLGGSAFLSSGVGRAIGNWTSERFALLHFEALRADNSSFDMWEGISGIGTVPVSSLSWRQLYFDPQTVIVCE